MKTTCIRHPESSRYIQLHAWQISFCNNDYCAALLLSFFAVWHDWKLQHDHYYKRYNDIAESHGEEKPYLQNAYLFFTTEDLVNAIMGLFGRKSIADALKSLASLKVITIHKNPNPRYCFDKTKYFRFYPEVCNKWIEKNYLLNDKNENDSQLIDNYDNPKVDDRERKNAIPASKNSLLLHKNSQAITNTTNNTTNKNQSNDEPDNFLTEINYGLDQTAREKIEPIVSALIAVGMSVKKFYPEAMVEIYRLYQHGATLDDFIKAYEISDRATQKGSFGINYLVKAVANIINASRKQVSQQPKISSYSEGGHYESDTKNARSWLRENNNANEK